MKFRKKPVVIEAVQLKPNNIADVYRFIYGPDSVNLTCRMAEDYWDNYCDSVVKEGLRLKTLESDGETQVASINDWIIKGVKGEFYPCKPDVFEVTYEPANQLTEGQVVYVPVSVEDELSVNHSAYKAIKNGWFSSPHGWLKPITLPEQREAGEDKT